MKKQNYILEDIAIIIVLILLSAGFFFAVVSTITEKMDRNERAQEEREQVEAGYMLQHQIRVSGMYGMNVNFNPEI